MRDVADRAGVSISTVSFVLNGRADAMGIRRSTQDRVNRCAAAIGYRGNYHARALLRGRASALGLAMGSSLQHRMWGAIATGVEKAARAAGYDLLIVSGADGEAALDRGIRHLRERRLDALVCEGSAAGKRQTLKAGVRAVVVQGSAGPLPSVRLDPAPGLDAAVDHLAGLGHRHVACVGKRRGGRTLLADRVTALRESCARRGLLLTEIFLPAEESYHDEIDWHLRYNHDALTRGLDLPDSVTGVFCYNDTLALALMALLRERGIRVPDDVSVIGFDDLHATLSLPALTTVSHMYRELGAKAVEVALALVDGAPRPAGPVLVPAQLVVRQSTGPAAGGEPNGAAAGARRRRGGEEKA